MEGISITISGGNNGEGETMQKFGRFCEQTDLVPMTGGRIIWNPDTGKLTPYTGWTITKDKFRGSNYTVYVNDIKDHYYASITVDNTKCAIRPILTLSKELYNYIIENAPKTIVSNMGGSKFEAVILGSYPQEPDSLRMQKILDKKLDDDSLIKTGCSYTLSGCEPGEKLHTYDEYEYNGKRYIRLKVRFNVKDETKDIRVRFSNSVKYKNGDYVWMEVKPFVWLIEDSDYELISVKDMLAGIPIVYNGEYDMPFTETDMSNFLTKHMLPDLLQHSLFKVKESSKTDRLLETIHEYYEIYLGGEDIPSEVEKLLVEYNHNIDTLTTPGPKLQVGYQTEDDLSRNLNLKLDCIIDRLKIECARVKPYTDMINVLNGKYASDELYIFLTKIEDVINGSEILSKKRSVLIKKLNLVISKYINKCNDYLAKYKETNEIPNKTLEQLKLEFRTDLHVFLEYLHTTAQTIDATYEIIECTKAIIKNDYKKAKNLRVGYLLNAINESAATIRKIGNQEDIDKLISIIDFELDYNKTMKELLDELEDILVKVYVIELDALDKVNAEKKKRNLKVNLGNVSILKKKYQSSGLMSENR